MKPARLLALAAGLAFATAASVQAFAQDGTLKKIKDSGTITIGHRDAS
ncbi:MAG: amino acid ABC transporter substrate-binding protein, partial [Betaproteobacteria bacterium]|nr:amino acid ABC transporter substrate-binding protein [Betaproteobacteria bacterium]